MVKIWSICPMYSTSNQLLRMNNFNVSSVKMFSIRKSCPGISALNVDHLCVIYAHKLAEDSQNRTRRNIVFVTYVITYYPILNSAKSSIHKLEKTNLEARLYRKRFPTFKKNW